MTALASPRPTPFRASIPWLIVAVAGCVLLYALLVWGPQRGLPLRPHAPEWRWLSQQTGVLQLHVGSALAAFVLGLVQLTGVKGATWHRRLGWLWAGLMATVAVSSLFIHNINPGGFSWIHILSGWSLVILPLGLYAARRHDMAAHRRHMTGLFVGALVIAGMLTFFPGRSLWRVFLG
ncbi:DUF2306 domain-containing protein [Brevundimonas sp. NIBR11]|uniref:DUF2306 domain-containing protein n=1 Tax=Brevundimonas sp. NIBR11 TaxID=3015999 RepID=UPI0022F09A7C|nr:DUF2306 domain-containing protein [Brevundimonas sp. NIBR11]WGM32535.1 hypothetical protein KKHFBJBL_02788 [Brevundimonas sp. NIBR11]